VIATLAFEPARGAAVRRARFVPRPRLSVDAACAFASGVRDGLHGVLGEMCALSIGDPMVLGAAAWRALARDALAFVLPGRATDVIVVVPQRDARALIAAAFREEPAPHDASWTALEAGAVERIIARCAVGCDALCGERRGPLRAVDSARLEPCAGFFDVRVRAPIALTIGVGIARALCEPPPATTVSQRTVGAISVETRVVLGHGTIAASRLLELRPGDVVWLDTKVAGEGELNVAGQRIALGTCGVVKSRAAFDVQSTSPRGAAS
jgi:flagellar motor switch/type III secretory pathway protein FliN